MSSWQHNILSILDESSNSIFDLLNWPPSSFNGVTMIPIPCFIYNNGNPVSHWLPRPHGCNSYHIVTFQNHMDYTNLPKTRMETENSLHLALDLPITVRHSMCRSRHGRELQKGKIWAQEDRHYEQDVMRQWKMQREMLPQPNTHILPLQFMPVARENKKKLRLGSTTANKDKIRFGTGFSTKLVLGFIVTFFFYFAQWTWKAFGPDLLNWFLQVWSKVQQNPWTLTEFDQTQLWHHYHWHLKLCYICSSTLSASSWHNLLIVGMSMYG